MSASSRETGRDALRVLALNFGGADCASTLYRILQFQEPLRAGGIELEAVPAGEFHDWDSVSRYDLVLVQKKLFPTGRVRFLRRHARALIYDTDDATWHPHGRLHHWLTRWRTSLRLRRVVRAAGVCRVANEVLATAVRGLGGTAVVQPMALDEQTWRARSFETREAVIRVGWSGAPANLAYLEAIAPALLRVQRECPALQVVVFCGKAPAFPRELNHVHVPFQPGAEPAVVGGFDIGLLPLADNPFAAAKSPIKALQYLATGIPTIASPLDATRELFGQSGATRFASTDAEWAGALQKLVGDESLRRDMGARGRREFEARYTGTKQTAEFAALLRRVARQRLSATEAAHNPV